jgi:hypothetical protein
MSTEDGVKRELVVVVETAHTERAALSVGDERYSRGNSHAIAAVDGLEAQPNGEMGLADAGRPEDHEVLAVLGEVAAGQRLDLFLVDRPRFSYVLAALDETRAVWTMGAHTARLPTRPE